MQVQGLVDFAVGSTTTLIDPQTRNCNGQKKEIAPKNELPGFSFRVPVSTFMASGDIRSSGFPMQRVATG